MFQRYDDFALNYCRNYSEKLFSPKSNVTFRTYRYFLFVYNVSMKALLLLLVTTWLMAAEVEIEVLGSGGPEIDKRASTSYLLRVDGKARLLIDAGSGSMLRFEESGADLNDLDAIILTHLHIDHVVDLPAYMKAGYFTSRTEPLTILGPVGNSHFPSTTTFIKTLFGPRGAYRYMSDILTPKSDSFQILPADVDAPEVVQRHFRHFDLSIINVDHSIVPALGFRIDVDGRSIVISGDTSNRAGQLGKLAEGADLFVAHHAIAEVYGTFANELHMTPGTIADIAAASKVKQLLLTHRMNRTAGHEQESLKVMKEHFNGKIVFAEDGMKIKL